MVSGKADTFSNFRAPFIHAVLEQGHRITAVASDDDPEAEATLKKWGVTYLKAPLARTGMNPFADLKTFFVLLRLMRQLKPDVFFANHAKAVTYGLMAARLAGVPHRYALITGLGYAFIDGNELKRRIAKFVALVIYRISLPLADRVIFQNRDDEAYFLAQGLVRDAAKTARVNGSGVDLSHFAQATLPQGPITFLLIARLLRDKGIYEYVEAARIVRRSYPQARFLLVGPYDPNPAAITREAVEGWVREGVIDYRGELRDVRGAIVESHVYVLPSYREGMPKTVLEAMAMGRPVITTDVPGCRDVIVNGENGLLVTVRDAPALADAMIAYLTGKVPMEAFATASRERAISQFDSKQVSRRMVELCDLMA